MATSLPLLRPTGMTLAEWISTTIFTLFFVAFLLAILVLRKHPRIVAYGLLPFALYSLVTLINLGRTLLFVTLPPAGPGLAVSLLIVSLLCATTLAAAALAWPLRRHISVTAAT